MPRKAQREKADEIQFERPATRRSVRLSASSPEDLRRSRGKGSPAKAAAVASPASSAKTSRTSRSPSGKKQTETGRISPSKAAPRGKAEKRNEPTKAEAKAAAAAAAEEEEQKELASEDSATSQKKRARQTRGRGATADAKDEKPDEEKEPEKDDAEDTADAKKEPLGKDETAPIATTRQRRGKTAATPAVEKTPVPRRGGRSRGKDSVETEGPSTEVSTSNKTTKRKRGEGEEEEDDDLQECEEASNSPKKQKTETADETNAEKMEVDAEPVEESKDASKEEVDGGIPEITEQEPSTQSHEPKTSECVETGPSAETEPDSAAAVYASAAGAAAVGTGTVAAVADVVKENGLEEQVDEVMIEADSQTAVVSSDAPAAGQDAQTAAAPLSDKAADVAAGNATTGDLLLSRKFAWFRGVVQSPSDLLQTFSVVSYNILADCHAQRDYTDPGSWIAREHLAIEYRHDRIIKEIKFLDSDIICLQEVGTDYFASLLKPALVELGYDGLYVPRHTTVYGEGEATFFRTRCFKLESSQSLVLSQVAEREIDESGIESDVKNSVKEAVNSYAVALLTRLRCLASDSTIACANIHVAYDSFERQDKQCLQLACAIRELVKFAGGPEKPHFICGDFNSWPDTPPYQLVHDGQLSEKSLTTLQSINAVSQSDGQLAPLVNYWSEGFQYSPADSLRSAYVEVVGREPLTSRFQVDGIVRAVDYIWFSSSALEVKGVLETVGEEKIKDGVPNDVFPSDHLSLKAIFSFK